MKDNINIAEILKDCPKGMKMYSPLFGEVELCVSKSDGIAVFSKTNNGDNIFNTFTENGIFYSGYSQSQCLLFPSSEMTDWSKFFKRGDVVVKNGGGMAAVFDGWANDTYTEFNTTINLYCDNNTGEKEVCDTLLFRKATEEEREQFVEKAERAFNGKYNPETLQVEQVEPVKPTCPFKPFDKVLVRDGVDEQWRINIFSHHQEKYGDFPYVCMNGVYRYCIPYNEHTAQLLDTTSPYIEEGIK